MNYLLDTCILIDHLRGYLPACEWLVNRIEDDAPGGLLYSAVTVTELLAGARERDEVAVFKLLGILTCVDVDAGIAGKAGLLLRKWRRSHGLEVPDALLAATAIEKGCCLVTRNSKHFPMDGLKIVTPYH
ncbi:MAG: type II toxin-antitoxin system VapC family toxin [bacterium]|nr:type II toxin-antitoxin system VapC family toxin [bacterium]